jgi:hypothetical protein
MSRRFFAVLSLALVTLSLAACSDATAPTPTSQQSIHPTGASNAKSCMGGSLLGTGRSC